jgi:hypothetical protein
VATSLANAYVRIYEVLCEGRGTNRALAAGYFRRGGPPGFLGETARAPRARDTPRVFVHISSGGAMPGYPTEMHDEHLYQLDVVLLRDHWLGYQGGPDAVEAALVRIADDHMKIAAALCWPGNLATTHAGTDTGLCGAGALARGGSRFEVVSQTALGRDGRLVQVRDVFTGAFAFDPDA